MSLKDISWDMVLCGLGLFLFGVVFMGNGLKSFAGDKLRDYIDKYTSKPWQGVLVGALMTALVQSSTATTAISIGFIRAGLMSLEQAAGIIIGANIGSTITSFLIGLNIKTVAIVILFAGAIIMKFAKKKKWQDLGQIFVGFGALFYGIKLIGETLVFLKDVPQFQQFAELCAENPIIGLFGGIFMTFAMQSSAAAIGVIQVIYETGAISFKAILPFLFGSNIGTCIAAIVAAAGGNVSSKRAAFLHLTFNIIGTIIGFATMGLLNNFIMFLTEKFSIQPMMQIAVVHIIFNIVTALIVYPFIDKLCAFAKLVIKGEEPKKRDIDLTALDPKSFAVPSAALSLAYEALIKEKELVKENVQVTRNYYIDRFKDSDKLEEIDSTEDLIDKMDVSLTKFLTEIPFDHLSEDSVKKDNLYLEINKNLERIGDVTVNIAEFGQMIAEENGNFSDAAIGEIDKMFNCFFDMLEITFRYISTGDVNYYGDLMKKEDEMDTLEESSRNNHFNRMLTKECNSPVASSVYADILSNLERMGDHCCNIARKLFYLN